MADKQITGQNQCHFSSLPNEITEKILSFLSSYGDLQQAKLVCKTWQSLVSSIIDHRHRQFYDSVCSGSLRFNCLPPRSRIPARYSHSSCVLGKSMYVFGGCSSSDTVFNDVYELDLSENKWTKLRISGIPPPPKECASMVVHKKRIIIFGGWCLSPRPGIVSNARFHNEVHLLDVPSLSWSTLFKATDWPQPCARAGHAACVVQDQMIVFGGAQRLTRYNDVWILDLNLLCWTMPQITGKRPPSRFGHSQMMMDSHTLLIVGGWASQFFSDVWLLNVQTMTWSQVKVNNVKLEPPQLWCHPAIKAFDQLVVFSASASPTENKDEHTLALNACEEVVTLQTYILDCSELKTGSCTWQRGRDSTKMLTATSLHSVVKGRGEFFIFGGRTNLTGSTWNVVNTLVKVTPCV